MKARVEHNSFHTELTSRVICSSVNAERAIEIGPFRGDTALRPDPYTSWVEFECAHAFPVVTNDGIALHPQVIENSYRSLFAKVFNIGHFMKAYNPDDNPRDRIVGSIFAAEFPRTPIGGWTVQAKKSEAPAIRAVACLHKKAEGVDRILGQHQSGRRRWTVSRENDYFLEDSGFLLKWDGGTGRPAAEMDWWKNTPKDIAALGWCYVACADAPSDLLACYNTETGKLKRIWKNNEVVLLCGGLNGNIFFKGTAITPLGTEREAEAEIQQMLAADLSLADLEEEGAPLSILKNLGQLLNCSIT